MEQRKESVDEAFRWSMAADAEDGIVTGHDQIISPEDTAEAIVQVNNYLFFILNELEPQCRQSGRASI